MDIVAGYIHAGYTHAGYTPAGYTMKTTVIVCINNACCNIQALLTISNTIYFLTCLLSGSPIGKKKLLKGYESSLLSNTFIIIETDGVLLILVYISDVAGGSLELLMAVLCKSCSQPGIVRSACPGLRSNTNTMEL